MTRRIRAVGEAAVPDWVAREARKFEYPDFDTIAPAVGGGGAGGAPTVVVAASDASDLSKSKADFVCTGVDDHNFIQQALDLLPTAIGGRVLLTEGFFNCSYGQLVINSSNGAFVVLQGLGNQSTWLNFDGTSGSGIDVTFGSDTICDLGFRDTGSGTGAALRLLSSAAPRIDNVRFDTTGAGIEFAFGTSAPRETVVTRCYFIGGSYGIDGTASTNRGAVIASNNFLNTGNDAILLTGMNGCQIIGNSINASNVNGITIGANCSSVTVVGNDITGVDEGIDCDDSVELLIQGNTINPANGAGIHITDCDDVIVAGNFIDVTGTQVGIDVDVDSTEHGPITIANNATETGGISVDSYREFVIIGNSVLNANAQPGIAISGSFEGIVQGNALHFPGQHGIILDADCEKIDVVGNLVVEPGGDTANTFDGIQTSADIGLILGNHIIPGAVTSTRFGVNVAAGSDNAVYANFLGDSSVYGTADSVDSGANTIVAAATGAIGGQFAY